MLVQQMCYFINRLTDSKLFLQKSRSCTFASPQGSWALQFGERAQCSCHASINVQGFRCSKPFSHGARAGPKAPLCQGDATAAPSHPEGGEHHRVILNAQGYRHGSRTGGEVFITLLH